MSQFSTKKNFWTELSLALLPPACLFITTQIFLKIPKENLTKPKLVKFICKLAILRNTFYTVILYVKDLLPSET